MIALRPERFRVASSILAVALLTAPAVIAGDEDLDRLLDRGIALYDAGDYEGARQIFEAIDVEGGATGPVLYRLSFCRARTGDQSGAQEAQQRAFEKLLAEMEAEPNLERAFYLSNTYRNLRRPEEAKGIARAATERFESGEWGGSDDGLALFQVAKLYADQDREDRAIELYRRALQRLDSAVYPSYVAWARRYLAETAYDEQDYGDAVDQLAAIANSPAASARDLDRLAVALARAGRWSEAVAAWKRMESADLQSSDRARYCWRLARQAEEMGNLPDDDAEGNAFREMSKEQLEAAMRTHAEVAKSARQEMMDAAKQGPLSDDQRSSFQSRLDAARGPFIAASMEYALRGLPIRETAFFGGYAPLIFHETRWHVPRAKGRRVGPRTKGKGPAPKDP